MLVGELPVIAATSIHITSQIWPSGSVEAAAVHESPYSWLGVRIGGAARADRLLDDRIDGGAAVAAQREQRLRLVCARR